MKIKKTISFLPGIINYNLIRILHPLPPTELQINVTYKCNSRCQMCHIWQLKPRDEMTLNEWRRILKDPIFKSIKHLSLAGGEPFLADNLWELVNLFEEAMPALASLSLVTNGFLTAKIVAVARKIALLAKNKNQDFSISVSLDGLGSLHEKIRGVPQAFEKAKSTILALKNLEKKHLLHLSVSGVIMQENLSHIEDVEKWCRKEGIFFNYQIIGFHQNYVNNLAQKEVLDFRSEDRRYLFSLLRKLAARKFPVNPRSLLRSYYWQDMINLYGGGLRTTPCPFALDAFVLDSLGDVYYCLSEGKIGNCRKGKTVSEIYFNPKNQELRQQRAKTVCLKCNSGCFVTSGLAKDFKKFAWYFLTDRLGPAGVY